MRRRVVSLSVVVVLLVGAIATLGRGATAQEATPSAMAEHPIVGGWRCQNDYPGASFTSFALFHDDGTYVEEVFYGVTLLGVWEPTGERMANLSLFAADADPAEDMVMMGEGRFAIEVDETGDTFALQGAIQGQSADGTVLFTDVGVLSTCTRLAVGPMEAWATPAAAPPTT